MPTLDPTSRRSRRARIEHGVASLFVASAVLAVSALSATQPMSSSMARSGNADHPISPAHVVGDLGLSRIRGRFGTEISIRMPPRTPDATAAADLVVPVAPPPAEDADDLVVPTARPPAETADPTEQPVAGSPGTISTGSVGGLAPTPPAGITGSIAASDPRVGNDYILVSRATLVSLPMSGPAWDQLKAVADGNAGTPDLSNMDQDNNVQVLAQSLVFARTGDPKYRAAVLANLQAVVGTEAGSTLPLGREAAAYVLAADFIDLVGLDPGFDNSIFRPWLRSLLTIQLDGRTLVNTHEERANNWGTHAGASRAAIAAYLGDGAELARTAQVFQGWLGDRSAYAGFSFGDLSWQANPSAPVAVLPVGAAIDGVSVDGALPEEMRRGGAFQWPPAGTDYPWGALEGAVLQAEILHRSGYDAYNWSDRALLRAVRFLFEQAQWRPAGNDQWVFWVIDYRYGTAYRSGPPIAPGKNFGWSDWLYGPAG